MESKCELCGHPMPPGEEMFKYHGYSGPCPGPPLAITQGEKEKMSLGLDLGTKPEGTRARTDFDGKSVEVGELEISTEDFCQLAMYVLTNTDLQPNDPRLHFMEQLAKLNVIEGHMPGRKRLG